MFSVNTVTVVSVTNTFHFHITEFGDFCCCCSSLLLAYLLRFRRKHTLCIPERLSINTNSPSILCFIILIVLAEKRTITIIAERKENDKNTFTDDDWPGDYISMQWACLR